MRLVAEIRRGVLQCEAEARGVVRCGTEYRVDIPITGPKGTAVVRTGWILKGEHDAPRLVTLYVA